MNKGRREFLVKSAIAGFGISTLNGTPNASSSMRKNAVKNNFQSPQNDTERKYYKNVVFMHSDDWGELTKKASDIFNRVFEERTGLVNNNDNSLKIKLQVNPMSLPSESFRIKNIQDDNISISAGDENGILYGIGKLLHTSTLNGNGFSPGGWEGVSIPKKPLRSLYFATHFYNFYHVAPINEVKRYIEELSLWGYNHLCMWFDMHHYNGINDVEAQQMLDRLAEIYKEAKSVGMKVICAVLANEGYKNSPVHLRAEKTGRSHYGVEICPSIKEGAELIVKQIKEEFLEYEKRGIVFDKISIWPYDQGGCGCDKCTPWGYNGFINISESIANELRNNYPKLDVILSTWLFDHKVDQGEWKGLSGRFKKHPPQWINYLLADSHTTYPEYLLNNPVPGNLPLINFPEISMWNQWPWGGFGATPLPGRFQRLWEDVKDKVAGGFPYSEGIYEDINQVLYSQFYWHEDINCDNVIREYVSYEFSEKFANDIAEAIQILEKNHGLSAWKWYKNPEYGRVDVPSGDFGAEKAYSILKDIDQRLPSNVRNRWRWRILIIRAMLDYEFRLSDGEINMAIENGLRELFTIYHSDIGFGKESNYRVAPPVNNGEIYKIKNVRKGEGPNQ
jgi:hypothetical protein